MKPRWSDDVGFARYLFGKGYRVPPWAWSMRRAWAREEVRFAGVFVALSAVAWLVYHSVRDLSAITGATANVVAWSAEASGLQAATRGASVAFEGGLFTYKIDAGCTGLYVALMYASAIVAYPARWDQRVLGLLVGLPVFFVVNVGRLVSMGWLGVYLPELWEDAHAYWWQVFFILAVGAGWLVWARFVAGERRALSEKVCEAVVAVGVLVGVLLCAMSVAAFTPVAGLYVHALTVAAGFVLQLAWNVGPIADPPHPLAWFVPLAAMPSLFLAVPRVAWRRRLSGSVTWGLAPFVVLQALLMTLGHVPSHRPFVRTVATVVLMVVPVAIWFAWVRRHGLVAGRRPLRECPDCRRRFEDVMGHVRDRHKHRSRALVRELLAKYPDLERGEGRRSAR